MGFVKSLYDWNYTELVQDNNGGDDDNEESDSDADFVINTKDNDEKDNNTNDNVNCFRLDIISHYYCKINSDYQIKKKKV